MLGRFLKILVLTGCLAGSLAWGRDLSKCAADLQAPPRISEKYISVGHGLGVYTQMQSHAVATGQPPIVVLHGAGSNSQQYEAMARALFAGGHDILLIDLVGHGRTLQKSGVKRISFADHGAYIAQIMKAYGLKNPVIYGHSLGGAIALNTAIQYKKAGGELRALILDEPYVMPLEDYYYDHQDELLPGKISAGVKSVGMLGLIGGAITMCTPLALTGIPQMALVGGWAWTAWGKVGEMMTSVCASIAVPLLKNEETGKKFFAKKLREEPSFFYLNGRFPEDPDRMAAGAFGALDSRDLRGTAREVGETPVFILLGPANPLMPEKLMRDYQQRFDKAQIVSMSELSLRNIRPHLHPQVAPEIVAEEIQRVLNR